MRRVLLASAAALLLASAATAHFVFVVPQMDGKSAQVVFSDTLDPDEAVPIERIAGLKLTAQFAGGKGAPVECKKGEHSLTASWESAPQMLHGTVVYGMFGRA